MRYMFAAVAATLAADTEVEVEMVANVSSDEAPAFKADWIEVTNEGVNDLFANPYRSTLEQATGYLAFSGTNPSNGDTVVVNGRTYTFRTGAVSVNDEVHVGANAVATALNLQRAINDSGGTNGNGGDYKVASAHATVTAESDGVSKVNLTSILGGTSGNALTLAVTGSQYTRSGATLSGGVDGTYVKIPTTKTFRFEWNRGDSGPARDLSGFGSLFLYSTLGSTYTVSAGAA